MIHKTIQGVDVPALGFGTFRLAGRACREAVEDALEVGYRHVDTAQAYENEKQVGQALAASGVPRDEIFLTTKIWMDRLEPEDVRVSTEKSLEVLSTDYVDLLLIHWPNEDVPLESSLDAMVRLREEGKTRQIGVSNFTPPLIRRAVRHTSIFCNQVEYHPYLAQDEVLGLAGEHDFLVTAYSPIARGKVSKDETLQEIAAAHGRSAVQVTLRWLLQQPQTAAVPKAAGADHRRHNFEVFDFELSNEEMRRVSSLARGDRIVDPVWAPAW